VSRQSDFIAAEAVGFQGRITASVSHEINNVLATISETAGLSADLMELGRTGRTLDVAALRGCADAVVDEVKRGFRVVKNLNVFAHSADRPVADVDLGDLVALMVDLAGYLSYASEVILQSREGPGPRVTTRPLLLEDLVYRAVIHGFGVAGPDGSIAITTDATADGGRIVISGFAGVGIEGFLGDDVQRILHELNARIETDQARDEMHILLPLVIDRDTSE
jgi:hypothetical protein